MARLIVFAFGCLIGAESDARTESKVTQVYPTTLSGATRRLIPWLIGTRVGAGFSLAAVLVVAIALISYRSAARFVDTAGMVAHTLEVEATLGQVLSHIRDVEEGTHGYVITGDDRYLQPLQAGRKIVSEFITDLRQITAQDKDQQRRLDTLETLIGQMTAVSQQVVDARQTGGLEAGVRAVESLQDKRTMDAIRAVIAQMKSEEWEALQEHQIAEHVSSRNTMRSFALLTTLVVVLLATVAYLVQRDLAARQHAQETLQAARDDLDRRVEERTAELAQSNELLRQEISERKRAQDARWESEHRFTEFMQHLPGVAFMKDLQGRYVFVNNTFTNLFHVKLNDCAGKTDDELWPPAAAAQFRENDERVLRTNQVLQTTEMVPHDDGLHQWLATKFPITNDDGTPRLVAGVAVDITERMRAQEQLRELEKLAHQRERLADIGAITAKIVHDLGNPLAGISMQAQLILHRAGRSDTQPLSIVRKPVEMILAEVRRLDVLVKGFMDFSRDQRLELRPLNLPRFLQDVAELWQPVAAARDIALTIEAPQDVPPLPADEDKLRRVFDNLVKNAIEAIDQGPGSVGIQVARTAPEAIRISVTDTGPGIPETVQVFHLFETTKVHGSGLGLAVAQQIVLAHRGRIEFERLSPRGTAFRIDLPCEIGARRT